MSSGDKRWIGVGLLVVVTLAGGLAFRRHRAQQVARLAAPDAPTLRGLAAGDVGAPALPSAPESKERIAAEVTTSLAAWRQAILIKNAEGVVALDRAFLASPDRYRAALAESATGESDERVRAFSTRELGKYKNPALAELFERQLADKSPFVRQNAAWALGELAAQDDGREAARQAATKLRQARTADPAPGVRSAAKIALARLDQ